MTGFPNAQNNAAGAIPVWQVGSLNPTATPVGYQQIVTATLATAQPLTVPTGATTATITVEGGDVRYRDDGTAPTASVGMPLVSGQSMIYSGPLADIEFIRQAAGAALNILYYKAG